MKKIILFLKQSLCILFILTIFSGSLKAEPLTSYDYSEMAKNRSYVGGAEESDLKKLPDSYFQKNKNTKNTEEVSEGF